MEQPTPHATRVTTAAYTLNVSSENGGDYVLELPMALASTGDSFIDQEGLLAVWDTTALAVKELVADSLAVTFPTATPTVTLTRRLLGSSTSGPESVG